MLRSYSAELNGTALVWLGESPPAPPKRARVLVVMEDDAVQGKQAPPAMRYDLSHLAGRLQWQGDAVAAQRELRDAW
jgi:hypothetical protein